MEIVRTTAVRADLGRLIKTKERELEKLTTAFEAISAVDGTPADMPRRTAVEVPEGAKIDKRRYNGGNSTKAKDPSKDGRRNNGRKPGSKVSARKRSGRKRAAA